MIKYLKYIFITATVMITVTGCQEDPEDTFSKIPTAPVLTNNVSILLTENTMSETVSWAWTAARFMKSPVNYSLHAQYSEGTPVQLAGSITALNTSMAKTMLHKTLKGLSGVPENSSFQIQFYVSASDGTNTVKSNSQTVTVYAYGDAISPVVTLLHNEIKLDATNPTDNIDLIEWEAARLKYNEAVTYRIYLQYGNKEAVEIAKDLTTTAYSLTVEELNDFSISSGAPEAEQADLKLFVKAFSETYPEGIPSEPVTMKITTYAVIYPALMYLPGSYQGWDPASARTIVQSTLIKGLYEAFFDLTSVDNSDVEFKFSPNPKWEDDFGFENITLSNDLGFTVATSKVIGSSNIKVPSGRYRIALHKKLNTLTLVQVKTVGLIGDATPGGWREETKMKYDAKSNTYSVVVNMLKGKGYKFRLNDNWTYAIGNDGTFDGGNYTFGKEDGEYTIIVDVNTHPYAVKIIST